MNNQLVSNTQHQMIFCLNYCRRPTFYYSSNFYHFVIFFLLLDNGLVEQVDSRNIIFQEISRLKMINRKKENRKIKFWRIGEYRKTRKIFLSYNISIQCCTRNILLVEAKNSIGRRVEFYWLFSSRCSWQKNPKKIGTILCNFLQFLFQRQKQFQKCTLIFEQLFINIYLYIL
eukprot:TRINITY_DN5554_c1_g1_i1.p1 TRINITY_DN5554_c1_g1~~TRINITY_DN5554_c1_g1_i1.p1  ORF type:complete len:192 (-),score=-16.39 TRINITY_DN5554_c1_g1_i1:86-604(-)